MCISFGIDCKQIENTFLFYLSEVTVHSKIQMWQGEVHALYENELFPKDITFSLLKVFNNKTFCVSTWNELKCSHNMRE